MNISVNPSIQNIYPVVVRANPESDSRGQDLTDLHGGVSKGAVQETRRVEQITSVLDQTLSQQKFRFQVPKANAQDDEVVKPVTSAQALAQMIDKMGGTGVFSGAGQMFSILV